MALNINMPKPGGSNFKQILSVAGVGAGVGLAPFTGGASLVPAMMAGGALGGAAGGLVGGGIDAANQKGEIAPVTLDNAVQRRMGNQAKVNPLNHIEDALAVTSKLPTDLRQQYEPPLEQAKASERYRVTNQRFNY